MRGGSREDIINKFNSFFTRDQPYNNLQLAFIQSRIFDHPKLVTFKYKMFGSSDDNNFFRAFCRMDFPTNNSFKFIFNENMIEVMSLAIELAPCDVQLFYNIADVIQELFGDISRTGCSFDKLLLLEKLFLYRIDDCPSIQLIPKKKELLSDVVNYIVKYNPYLSVEDKTNYVSRLIEIYFAGNMSMTDDNHLIHNDFLMSNNILKKKLTKLGCRLPTNNFSNLKFETPVFSKNAEFFDDEMMPTQGIARGEFFYNIRDVDSDGRITRAFSKLNFDKLKNNPFTRREWKFF